MTKISLNTKLKPYPAYKDSGVEWIGKIPKEWGVSPLFAVTRENASRNTDGKVTHLLSLSYGRIIKKDIESTFGLLPATFNTYQIIKSGQTVMRLTDLQNDKVSLRVGFAEENGIITSAYLALDAKSVLRPRYLYYLLHAYDINKVYYGMGGGVRQSIGFKELKRMGMLLPSREEQEKVIDYLDEKTALIDRAIGQKEKLIELLKERRAALITHAVTKGLDAKAPLVDSGIPWIGMIPKGWEIKKLKHLSDIRASNVDKISVAGQKAVRLCNYTDVYNNEHITSGMAENFMLATATDLQIENLSLLRGDIVVTKDSETPDDIGIPSLIKEDLEGVVCGYHLAVIRPTKIEPRLLFRYLQSTCAKTQYFLAARGFTRFGLGVGEIGSALVVVPPEKEQKIISDYLNAGLSRIDRSVQLIDSSIRLLTEYKVALIHHVVMGKVQI